MGITFTDTQVSIAGEQLNTFTAADRFTLPTAWSPATIRWGNPDSLEPPTAATLSLRVTIPDDYRVPEWGDKITVTTTYPGTDTTYRVFTGRIDSLTRRLTTLHNERTGQGTEVTEVDLTASDEIATAGRIRLSDEPWPEESAGARWDRLRDLLAQRGVALDHSGGNETVRARDVDSFSALEALRLTTAHRSWMLTTDEGTIYPGDILTTRILLIDPDGGPAWIDDGTQPTTLPAYALQDTDPTMDTGGILSTVTINHPEADPDEPGGYKDRRTTIREATTEDTYGPGALTIDTDLTGNLTPATDRARRILNARSSAQWRLPALTVLLDRYDLPGFQFMGCIREYSRNALPVVITAGPPGLDPYHRVIGGTLTLHGDPEQQAVELLTEPQSFAGPNSVTIAALAEFPISSLTNITISDFRSVSQARTT